MSIETPHVNELWATLWVEELVRQGVEWFVISPGSRSTPLTVAAARHPRAKTQVVVDERAAAFFALGIGRSTGKPACLICSSGTAGANYFPAVIEASVDHVPMLICTADRPPELQETGANQTIRQSHLYGDYVRWHRVMPCPTESIAPSFVLTTAAQAFFRSLTTPTGPVHLNWPFREPLAPTHSPTPLTSLVPEELSHWSQNSEPWTKGFPAVQTPALSALKSLAKRLQSAQRGLLVVGRRPVGSDSGNISALAERLQWPLLADVGSGLRFGAQTDLQINGWDSLLRSSDWQESQAPDFILQLGGPLVGKRWLSYTQKYASTPTMVVQDHDERIDPTHTLSERWQAEPDVFAKALLPLLQQQDSSEWTRQWQSASDTFETLVTEHLPQATTPPLEPSIARELTRLWKEDEVLFCGNSMPIRDLDLWGDSLTQSIPIHANRGASGIDGLLATALGVVAGSQKRGFLLLGDLSLMHDLSSLALLKQAGLPLTVIVLNNQSGGIFEHLPVASREDVFEPFFATPHTLEFAPVASALGLSVHTPQTLEDFSRALDASRSTRTPALVEVRTSREQNTRWYRDFHALLTSVLHP